MTEMQLKSLMDVNFMEYASYVIKERAIPHIDDGLKPVQRRILHTLNEVDDGKYHKVANIVGHTMRYHPHGDASIEAALVNIAQKNYFIDQQGNFGNIITGDPASASRYIECRLTNLSREVLFNDEITRFVESYDGRNKEPVVLPSKIPSLLMMGGEGIAVGLSTKILPHNFIELLKAQIEILKEKEFHIYPDFIQGGLIDVSEYNKGKGKLKVRARIEVKDTKTLTITEIPFGTTTESLIGSIENAINRGKLKITSINDFTTENVEIELKAGHGINSNDLVEKLYLYTDCEMAITSNVIVIKDAKPVETDVHEILKHNTSQLVLILEKELNSTLAKLKAKLKERQLVKIFIENKLYLALEKAENYEDLQNILKAKLDPYTSELSLYISDDDIEKLVSIPIKRISKFDMDKTNEEIKQFKAEIEQIKDNLANITIYSINYLKELIKKYSKYYPRRSEITAFESIDVTKVAVQDIKVGFDPENSFIGTEIKGAEPVLCSSFDKLLIFFKNGEYKIINIPEKLFLEHEVQYFDRQSSLKTVSAIYQDNETGIYYMKRFVVSKFILDKTYRFIPENSKLIYFTIDDSPIVKIDYVPQKRVKVLTEYLHLGRLLVKSVSSIGNQVSNKEIKKIKLVKDIDIRERFEKEPEEVMRLKPPETVEATDPNVEQQTLF